MTQEELEKQIERAVEGFSILEGVDEDLANMLVGEGFLSYDDLEVIEPDFLMNLGSLTMEQVDAIVAQAEVKAEEAEKASQEKRRQQREQKDRDAQMAREAEAQAAAAAAAAAAEKTKEASSPGESSTAEADGASADSVTASPESGDAV